MRAVKPAARRRSSTARVTSANRNRLVVERAPAGNPQAIILMYHRVAECGTDPFRSASLPIASPSISKCSASMSSRCASGSSLRNFDNGGISRPTAVITFDDGYADNLADREAFARASRRSGNGLSDDGLPWRSTRILVGRVGSPAAAARCPAADATVDDRRDDARVGSW